MTKHNASNERIKHHYFGYLKEAERYSESSIDAVAQALDRFEEDTKRKDFKRFHREQAVAFKRHLQQQRNQRTDKPLSKATIYATLAYLKRFFHWLAGQPGYKSRLQYTDADYFNLSQKESRVATTRREPRAPTLEQVLHVLFAMPDGTDIERRNRALIAFTLITGARVTALTSIKLKHVDLKDRCVHQDAREVRTKASKSFTTWFFPVDEKVFRIVQAWVTRLREEKLWGNDDPLFPATRIEVGTERKFEATGLLRAHWSSPGPIRAIFRSAFLGADLPYFNPHSFRRTLVQLGERICKSPEDFKAWSQNLGHDGVLTTFLSYGEVSSARQSAIMRQFAEPECRQKIDQRAGSCLGRGQPQ